MLDFILVHLSLTQISEYNNLYNKFTRKQCLNYLSLIIILPGTPIDELPPLTDCPPKTLNL